MWHRVAPALAERHTVVAADLRGYGDSDKPAGGPGHANYAKRAMAADQAAVMDALGFERFSLAGHDRGARCAHRLALDHGRRVDRVAFLDIVPTFDVWERSDRRHAWTSFHWYFLSQGRRSAGGHDRRRSRFLAHPDAGEVGRRHGRLRTRGHGGIPALLPRPGRDPRHLRGLPRRVHHRRRPRRRRPATAGSNVRFWRCGGSGPARRATRRCWRSGATGPATCAAGRWLAATSWPRSGPRRPRVSSWRSFPREAQALEKRPPRRHIGAATARRRQRAAGARRRR